MSNRWLYHARVAGTYAWPYTPEGYAREGFVHCSYAPTLRESMRLYLPANTALEVLQIDASKLDCAVRAEPTPRGPMPHVFGPITESSVVHRYVVHSPDELPALPDEQNV